MSRHIEILPAKKYYGRQTVGWVVLVNGMPHHYTDRKDADDLCQLLWAGRYSNYLHHPIPQHEPIREWSVDIGEGDMTKEFGGGNKTK